MVDTIYIEKQALDYTHTKNILSRFPKAKKIEIEKYTQVFNSHSQHFRAQKINPSLILAVKLNKRVLLAPEQYETGGGAGYYFSHILNCPYDCRYCFLQGMYRSAHYLHFVNYDDFVSDIKTIANQHSQDEKPVWFYSGYDGDSLAYEPITGFAHYFVDAFANIPSATLELRTKSTQVRRLLQQEPIENAVVAFSLSPDPVIQAFEKGTPALKKRIDALVKLQQAGWRIGLRFDPVVWHSDYQNHYRQAIKMIFLHLKAEKLDSVTIGGFRVPKGYLKTMKKLYPSERLFSAGLQLNQGMQSYKEEIEQEMLSFMRTQIHSHIESEKLYIYPSY